MVKHKIFKYFFLEFFKFFLITSLSLSLLIWLTQTARLLDLVTELGNPISIYLKYIVLIFPKIFENIFLISFIISLFFLFSKLENENEISIYWLSGISKEKIRNLLFQISIIIIILNIILASYISPLSSRIGRGILANSNFSLVNSLLKENNFNSPLKNLTVYVDKNNQKGILEGIFIYEENRTIVAKRGEVLSDNTGTFLKLYDGITQEKNDDKINIINFQSTIFNFSKYQMQNTVYLKFSERELYWLFKTLKDPSSLKKNEIREEINKRLIKPFFILVLSSIGCLLLNSNSEKLNLKKLKFFIYILSIVLIIFNQVMLGYSGYSSMLSALYIIIIIFLTIIIQLIFNKTSKV